MTTRYEVVPSAHRLIGSLRDVGYDFVTAIADLADNSVEAGATDIHIDIRYRGEASFITVADNGVGMSGAGVTEALRFGSQREYGGNDLGRYGLGLKTASLSQCARLSVLSRRSLKQARIAARTLDFDQIAKTDRWEVVEPDSSKVLDSARSQLRDGPGTVVVWENLDRIFGPTDPWSGWGKRRLATLAARLDDYLGMVFERFLAGVVPGRERLNISVNGMKVRAWSPFASGEESTLELPNRYWEMGGDERVETVRLRRFVLPPREEFSSPEEFERLGGPKKWNRQQGLYIYRSDRLIQSGGWSGMRTIDEHTKLARASLDFPSALDHLFHVNVAKMRVAVPSEIRTMLKDPIHELCREADNVYRRNAGGGGEDDDAAPRRGVSLDGAALAIRAAAMGAGITSEQVAAFVGHLRDNNPDIAARLGFR